MKFELVVRPFQSVLKLTYACIASPTRARRGTAALVRAASGQRGPHTFNAGRVCMQAEVARLKLERDDAMATCDDLRAQVEQLQHDLRVQRQASDELRVAGERCSPPPRELQETELKHAQLEQTPAAPSCGDNGSRMCVCRT